MSCNLPSCSVSRAALIGGIAGADLSTPAYDHWGAVLWSAVRASPLVCAELVVASLCMALVAADAAGGCCAAIKYPTLPGWPSRRPGNLAAVMPSPETISVISSKHPRRAIVSGWVLERSSMSCLRIDEGAVKDESLTHVWIVVLAGVSRRGDSSLCACCLGSRRVRPLAAVHRLRAPSSRVPVRLGARCQCFWQRSNGHSLWLDRGHVERFCGVWCLACWLGRVRRYYCCCCCYCCDYCYCCCCHQLAEVEKGALKIWGLVHVW